MGVYGIHCSLLTEGAVVYGLWGLGVHGQLKPVGWVPKKNW